VTAIRARGSKRPATPDDFSSVLTGILELEQHITGDDNVGTVLKAQLDRLPKPWRDRIGTLLNLGRKVHERSHIYSSVPEGHAVTPLDALALCDKQTRAQQYLERGLAMMCSESLDIDGGETVGAERKTSVFERAWSHFGRELASSEPDEWNWFALRANRTDELEKLYLRRGDGAWWSFGVSLDRPQKSQIGTQQAKAAKRRQGNQGSGLTSLVTHQYCSRRALHRAMRSVHARMGIIQAGSAKAAEVG
jgi:hypothetical protein